MLVLTRKSGEAISIDGVSIVVRVASGGRVTFAIDAPDDVRIRRSEVAPVVPAANPVCVRRVN